ncbi:MAG: NAD-binding protein, partial [Hyphomicrobiaceae bacterium]
MNICMIGAGYVGLVSAACFSEFGWSVTCVDKDPERLKLLAEDRSPIYEPGLDDLIARNKKAGRLRFSGDLADAVRVADIV